MAIITPVAQLCQDTKPQSDTKLLTGTFFGNWSGFLQEIITAYDRTNEMSQLRVIRKEQWRLADISKFGFTYNSPVQ